MSVTDELEPIIARIRQHIRLEGDCWIWTAAQTDGRGVIRINGLLHRADRILWQIRHGHTDIPFELANTCGNRSCVNPDHHRTEPHPCNSMTSAVTYRTRVGPLRTHRGRA